MLKLHICGSPYLCCRIKIYGFSVCLDITVFILFYILLFFFFLKKIYIYSISRSDNILIIYNTIAGNRFYFIIFLLNPDIILLIYDEWDLTWYIFVDKTWNTIHGYYFPSGVEANNAGAIGLLTRVRDCKKWSTLEFFFCFSFLFLTLFSIRSFRRYLFIYLYLFGYKTQLTASVLTM